MRIFKVSWFSRFAAKEGIQDGELRDIVNIVLEAGRADADLGGGVYKVRMARPGEGKSGGYRVIVFFRSGERTFFVYGFEKANMANISKKQLKNFRDAAKIALSATEKQLNDALKTGKYEEI
ncbi:MAG: type II toxin-antitoxin system RelE/ParE family toxin [Treponema sp.]|nr:type II toxin-antitoxin system RelE/ParE family toxin [Treponema sp.]